MKLLQSNWKHYQIKNQNQDFHKNMNTTNNWEFMKEFLLFDESETLILFEGSRPENRQNFQEKIIYMSNTSSNFKRYMWILVEHSKVEKNLALDFPLLAESENVRLDSQIYAVTLTCDKIAVFELYRIWWNTPLISSLILKLEDHKIVYQGDFIWNRRKNLQGLP